MESQHGSQESTSSGGTGDFHSAMETFAEAWVAVNTETALTSDGQSNRCLTELPTMVHGDNLLTTSDSPSSLSPAFTTQGTPGYSTADPKLKLSVSPGDKK